MLRGCSSSHRSESNSWIGCGVVDGFAGEDDERHYESLWDKSHFDDNDRGGVEGESRVDVG